MKTIIVQGFRGKDKDVTLDQFVDIWVENANLWTLADYRDLDNTNKMYKEIERKIADLATHKFNLLYEDGITNDLKEAI